MGRVIFLMLVAFLAPANAQIYKWVGPEGQVHFSDEPRAGAEVIILPSVRPSDEKVHAAAPGPEKSPVPTITVYRAAKVLEPEYGATIRDNRGMVEVVVAVDPELDTEAGDLIQILLDHRPFGEPSQTLEQELYNLDRGTHRIAVRVINRRGRTLISSAPVVFHLRREFRERLEPTPHDRFAALFIEEAGDELTPAERARLEHVTRDDSNELMDKLIPAFVERLGPDKREAFMKRFIPRVAAQLPPEDGERVIKRFMRKVTWRLKPAERLAFTETIVKVVNEYLEPGDRGEARFVTTEYQQEYWNRFLAMISGHLSRAERARLRYLANPEQRRAFMEGYVPRHLERLKPRQQRQFIERLVAMLAAQLSTDRRQAFLETVVETGMDSVSPEDQGEFVQRFIERGVNPDRQRLAEEKSRADPASWLGAIPRPQEPDEYPGRKRNERRKGAAEQTPPEEREGFSKDTEGSDRVAGNARRDRGVERHPKQEGAETASPGRTRVAPRETAPQPGFRTGAPQPVTPSPSTQSPPRGGLGPFSASTGR